MSCEMFAVFSCVLLQVWKGPLVLGIPDRECCYTKEVGGVRYILEDTEDTSPHNCNSNCVYKEESDSDSIYCFQDGDLPVSCVNQRAPIMTEMPIEEGNESIVQENYFQEETGILTVKVPPHKNYTASVFFLHQDSKTSMLKTGGMCQVTELPDYIDVSAMAQGFQSHNRMKVRESNKVTNYLIKSGEARYGVKKRAEILHPEADRLCNDAPVVKTNDEFVTKEEFEKFMSGEIITFGNAKNTRQSDDCTVKYSTTGKGLRACGYGWINPAGGGLSWHHVSEYGITVACALPEFHSSNLFIDDCAGSKEFSEKICQCKKIKNKNNLMECYMEGYNIVENWLETSPNPQPTTLTFIPTTPSGRNLEETSSRGNMRANLAQTMLYNATDDEGHAVTIVGPSYADFQSIDVVMNARPDGYWHGGLKNNKLLKIGDTCYVATLPYGVFPVDIVSGIKEIKEGNDVTTEEDEEVEQEILIPAGILTSAELAALHPVIKEKCKDSSIEKFVVANDSQEETLNNGGVIILENSANLGYAAMVDKQGSGSWRYPNRGGSAKLWINQIESTVKRAACCVSDFCTSLGVFCECGEIDSTNYESCSSAARKAKQMKKYKNFA